MKDVLKYVPGFRTGEKFKMIIASAYYITCSIAIIPNWGVFLLFFAAPFVLFHGMDAFKNKSKKSAVICLIAFIVMCFGRAIVLLKK
ncbi:hypothetical protein ACFHWD_18465 [Clostridium sp. MT-14]|uniref:Uncharacterized protein n=1 Tax=Clostridium aromativorans TaxID=2836848 RepID=A0ABS8N4T5_9CLOT|nr:MULTISPECIES: hypothetical protein [Clostridium]KAA8667811.1 hypothetical protein F3O63_15285 [Clostridium sp. HV4-5-A1G]MCC9294806.1 hypothetical protein [Clostridium aromativorans]CAB1262284.1 conserved hypothetical protein [Clostridiaceae bacterium BL-3]